MAPGDSGYESALSKCRQLGGGLLAIHTEEENKFIVNGMFGSISERRRSSMLSFWSITLSIHQQENRKLLRMTGSRLSPYGPV